MFKRVEKNRVLFIIFLLLLAVGLVLRGYQYFMGRSLWHDEAHLALNFIYHDYAGLTKPLDHWQVAPIFFLFAVETSSRLFGFSEIALRLPVFLISIATLPVFYYFCKEMFKSKVAALIALAVFVVNISMVYYASELKPYALDACAYILFPWLVLSGNRVIEKYRAQLLISGAVMVVFFTNTSVIILLCSALYMLTERVSVIKKGNGRYIVNEVALKTIYILGVIGIIFLVNYFLFVHDHPYTRGMKDMWAHTFWPDSFTNEQFKNFISIRAEDTFYYIIRYSRQYFFPYLFWGLVLIGTVHGFVKRKKAVIFFAVLPIVVQVLLSMLKMYPFYARFVINTLPAVIALFALGTYVVANFLTRKIHAAVGVVVVATCIFFMSKDSLQQFPRWDINLKPSLAYINEYYPDATVLVTTPATMYEFYYRTGFVHNGNYQTIGWNLTPETYLEQEAVKAQTGNYVLLHSRIGGDNSAPIVEYLQQNGMVVNDYGNNDFAVTEIKPLSAIKAE